MGTTFLQNQQKLSFTTLIRLLLNTEVGIDVRYINKTFSKFYYTLNEVKITIYLVSKLHVNFDLYAFFWFFGFIIVSQALYIQKLQKKYKGKAISIIHIIYMIAIS
jgi:hypothetical protein